MPRSENEFTTGPDVSATPIVSVLSVKSVVKQLVFQVNSPKNESGRGPAEGICWSSYFHENAHSFSIPGRSRRYPVHHRRSGGRPRLTTGNPNVDAARPEFRASH